LLIKKNPSDLDVEKFIVTSSSTTITVYSIPGFKKISKAKIKNGVLWSQLTCLNVENTENYFIAGIDIESNFFSYSLMDLESLLKERKFSLLNFNINKEDIRLTYGLLDGTLYVVTKFNEIFRLNIFSNSKDLLIKPMMFDESVILPIRPDSPKLSFFSSRRLDLSTILDNDPKEIITTNTLGTNGTDNDTSKSTETLVLEPETKGVDVDTSKSYDILDPETDTDTDKNKKRTPKKVKQKKGLEKSSTQRNKDQLSDTKEVMNENLNLLNERGERIQQLSEKMSELEDESNNFLKNARELKRLAQKKSWFF